MVTQKNLETLMHLSQVKDLGKKYDEARVKGKVGEGPTALSVAQLKEILSQAIFRNKSFLDHYNPESVLSKVDEYTKLSDAKPQQTSGYKAHVEYTQHREEVLSEYKKGLERENEEKRKKLTNEAKKQGKEVRKEDLDLATYENIGLELQVLSQELNPETINKIFKTGSDEEKAMLRYLLISKDHYEDMVNNKDALASDLSNTYGIRKSLFLITDTSARDYTENLKAFDARTIGKYFTETKGAFEKFFLDSPYVIAKMAEKLPEE